jgi:glycosyltransferase involved in cell wall biosynthesis
MQSILLVTPNLNLPGGVSEFNKLLLKHSSLPISTFILSGAGKHIVGFLKSILFGFDVIRFLVKVIMCSETIVHLGPSLGINALKRDAVFCWIAKAAGKKVYMQWHGWNPANEDIFTGKKLHFLRKTLFRADHIRFLSQSFERTLISIGYRNSTSVGNSFVDDDIQRDPAKVKRSSNYINILFLSTVSRNKGIFLALDLFRKLKNVYPNLIFTIAGDGPEMETIKLEVQISGLRDIEVVGHVQDDRKKVTYQKADLYLFPSYYEGMPLSVLEAMSYGLPIVCSSVGAIPDFFINEKMGFIIEYQDMDAYYNALELLITNSLRRWEIGEFNYKFAKDNFLASKNVQSIDEEYLSLLKDRNANRKEN